MRGLDALDVVGLDELAVVRRVEAGPDPRVVHADRMDPRHAELRVVHLEPVGAEPHQVVDELRPVVDVHREVDEAPDRGREVPRRGRRVQPPGAVADLVHHALEDRHVVELGRGEVPHRRQQLLGLVAVEQVVVARGAEALLDAVGVVEVAVGGADRVHELAPGRTRLLLDRLDPRVRLERPRHEHPRPDLHLADHLAVGRDHRIEAEVLLHLDDGVHRVVDPRLEDVEHGLLGRRQLVDQRHAQPAVDRNAVGRPSLECDPRSLSRVHPRAPWASRIAVGALPNLSDQNPRDPLLACQVTV